MNALAYLLIVVGALYFAAIGYDEYRGITSGPSDTPEDIQQQSHPETFHNAIVCHVFYASASVFLGILMLLIDRHMDKSDPESPDFTGNDALDEWGKSMQAEDERRQVRKK